MECKRSSRYNIAEKDTNGANQVIYYRLTSWSGLIMTANTSRSDALLGVAIVKWLKENTCVRKVTGLNYAAKY